MCGRPFNEPSQKLKPPPAQTQVVVHQGTIREKPEPEVPKVPMDYTWAKKLGLVRKPANFISSISDDRGEELKYCGIPISDVIENDMGT